MALTSWRKSTHGEFNLPNQFKHASFMALTDMRRLNDPLKFAPNVTVLKIHRCGHRLTCNNHNNWQGNYAGTHDIIQQQKRNALRAMLAI
ncbi:MAG: hypothetical protein ACKOEO_03990, partial [Planctomycetaceae bacterium]